MRSIPASDQPSAISGDTQRVARLAAEVELLKSQLMNTSMIYELTKVMHSSTDLSGITKTLLLGIQEILLFDRVILFQIDVTNFCLRPASWVGMTENEIKNISIPLGFEGGEITDAIFLNRHFIVDHPDPSTDFFLRHFGSNCYMTIPMLSKATRHCWDVKSCGKTACSAYRSYNPFCWSIAGSGQALEITSEDERRRQCIVCPCFHCLGVLWLDRKKQSRPISSDDVTTVSAVITQAGIIIDNFRIFNALEKANADLSAANEQLKKVNHALQIAQSKINSDLTHARSIQLGLLPQSLHDTTAFSIGARYIPAQAVGGDYYDVFSITPTTFGIVVADVSGHGIASALIMSMVKVLLKSFAVEDLSPQKTLERINEIYLSEVKTDNFVTIFYAVLDTAVCRLSYTSAGHCPILILDKEKAQCSRVNADGLFLGVFPDMMLKETSRPYVRGKERLILYTDGLTEAQNANDEMFDIQRLEKIAVKTIGHPPLQAVDDILAHQRAFCGDNRSPEDDITLLVIDL